MLKPGAHQYTLIAREIDNQYTRNNDGTSAPCRQHVISQHVLMAAHMVRGNNYLVCSMGGNRQTSCSIRPKLLLQ